MGCVIAKPSEDSPPKGLQKLKSDNGYVKTGGGFAAARKSTGQRLVPVNNSAKTIRSASTKKNSSGSGSEGEFFTRKLELQNTIDDEEVLVDGWPKWLTDNIPRDALAGLIPKSADSYDKLDKIGQGTYSNVYKARDRDTGKIVALKKVRFDTSEPESVKFMAREIRILRMLDHPNIVKLEGLATSRMQYSIYLVFDFMVTDLSRIVCRPNERLSEPQVKCYMNQLLAGLQHCHERGILHRDIKGSNLLIDRSGMLKIADFGLANLYNPEKKKPLTSRVVTLWYRAPELLLGATDYGPGIDLWSAGCLMAEMFSGRPVMPGRTEVEQLHRIFKLCGTPSEEYWKKLKVATTFRPPHVYKPNLREVFRDLPKCSLGLLNNLLSLDPSLRGSANSALKNEFFHTRPLACELSDLPMLPKVEEEDNVQSKDQRRQLRKSRTRLLSQKQPPHQGEQPTQTVKDDSAYMKEVQKRTTEPSGSSQVSRGSTTSSSSTETPTVAIESKSPPSILSPQTLTEEKQPSPKIEAYPVVNKNMKSRPPLPSTTKTRSLIKYKEYNDKRYRPAQVQRSVSTREHRKQDTRIHHKLHGLDD
ncbi:putative serine/threonine-protein kinase [Heracleum sosnowskyi]|uniref:Serine/threonine-protein kinase n=1 Tax=Heracleum sosnowskyi TaxID=360622 RepID=A0AAD8H7U5_9APIA|nr:putative serine/threonine-protein kinase [Heracleum sosnowskyi]